MSHPPLPSRLSKWLDPAGHGVTLCVIFGTLLLYLPFCGSYGFWDPWESHYGEVSRQMRLRSDYISLWWPGSPLDRDVFWSKPVLTFWVEALFFGLFGLGGKGAPPGQMALTSAPEWACRIPMVLFGLLGIYGVYYACRRLLSTRAAVLSSLICATSPLYALISRQAVTDMPFVGPMTAALGFAAASVIGEDRVLERRERGSNRWKWSHPNHPLFYIVLASFLLSVLPQLVYNSINLVMVVPFHGRTYGIMGIVPMLPYLAISVWFVIRLCKVQKRSELELILGCVLCALSGLSKGLIGVAMPALVLGLYLLISGELKRLLSMNILSGVLAIVAVAFPWYHAMLIRHGIPFWRELFGDNHWRRLAIGRHGDRGTFDYYVRELGYGMFPWFGLLPVAAARSLTVAGDDGGASGTGPNAATESKFIRYAGIWALASFALVTASMTKFHHYILPAIPALAILCGWFLDRILRSAESPAGPTPRESECLSLRALILTALPLIGLVAFDLAETPHASQRLLWLFNYDYINNPNGRPWPAGTSYAVPIITFAALAGASVLVLGAPKLRRYATYGLSLVAVGFAYFVIDGMLLELTPDWTLKHLFASYYKMRAPGDRLVAWQMYWRGETFYSQNEIYDPALPATDKTVFLGEKNQENLKRWLGEHAGKRVYFVVERPRLALLKTLLPTDVARAKMEIVDDSNNKFLLTRTQL